MKNSISLSIIAGSIIIGASIYFAGQNGRYSAGEMPGGFLYVLDSRSGKLTACEAGKLLTTDECWTLKDIQGR